MRERFEVQRFQGLTDGKPSWTKMFIGAAGRSREDAEQLLAQLRAEYPERKYRLLRKITRR